MYAQSYSKVTPIQAVDRSLPPQSLDAEESLLGGIILFGASALNRVKDIIEPDAFFVPAHREIYRAILKLDRDGLAIDLLTVTNGLRGRKKIFEMIGGGAKLAQLVDSTVSDVNLDQYAHLIQEKFLRRQAIAISNEIANFAYNSSVALPDIAEFITDRFTEITGSALVTGDDKTLKLRQCDRLLARLHKIQLEIDSPTYKEFMLQELARETGRSPQQLQSLFYKSLIEDEWEPTLTLTQLKEKYGDQVREWLLHGFIPKGVTTLIHALGGQGKTKLMYDFIYSLALGEPWQGFPVTKKSKILIIQTDEQPTDMLASLEIRGIRPDDDRFDIHYKTRWSTDHIPQLYREVQDERYDLILIDSLASVSRFSTVSENDAEFAKPILLLNKIASDFNAAIILIHHSSKSGDARGSTAVYNAVSQVFQLTKPENDYLPDSTNRILMVQKSRARRPAKYALSLNPEDGSWRFDGEDTPSPDLNSPLKTQIIEFLSQHRGIKFANEDLSQAINFSANTVRKVTNELASDGIISWQKQGRGKLYWIENFEGNVTKSQCDPRHDPADHMTDHFADHIHNPGTASDTARRDLMIRKNQKFSEKNFQKNPKNEDQWITSSDQVVETPTGQGSQNCKEHDPLCDPPCDPQNRTDHVVDRKKSQPVNKQPEIKKGDRVIIRDGCEFNPMAGIDWEAGTALEVLAIGKKGIYQNQLQVKKLGDNRCAAWVPIANIEMMLVSKEG